MDALIQDTRYALRQLRSDPGFTAVALLTLALGIGANTAVFSVIDGVLLRPPPFEEIDRLAMVWQTDRNSGTTREPASIPDYVDFRERSDAFRELGAFMGNEATLTPPDGDPVRVAGLAVTHGLLPLLGVEPLLGRDFSAEEDRTGGPGVALIGEGLWERRFSRDPGVLGRTLELDGSPVTVVGVLPAAADFGVHQVLSAAAYQRSFADRGERIALDVWVPLRPDPAQSSRDSHPIFVVGRLAPGTTVGAAADEMAAIAADLEAAYPGSNAGRGTFVEPLEEVVFGPVRPALLVLLAAVGLVLLVACVNVANLLLARGTARAREMAVRAALGAGPRRLARQFLVEGIVLAGLGAAAGLGVALLGTEALLALAPADIPRLDAVAVDGRVLAVTLAVSVAVGIGFGLVPTFLARRRTVRPALKAEATGAMSASGSGRVRSALVVAQLALAVVLLAGAGLLVRSFWRLQAVDPGFRAGGVLKAEFQLPPARYPVDFARWPDLVEIHRFNRDLLERVSGLPGVEAAALAGAHPLAAGFTTSFQVVGREAEAADWPEMSIRRVTPDYFRTVGLPLEGGRLILDSDGTEDPPVLLVNRAAAERFFPGADPIGERISFWGAQRTVVGVVGDERFHGLREDAPHAVYLPMAQAPTVNGAQTLLVRGQGPPTALAPALRSAVHEVDPGLAVFGVEPLRVTVARSVARERFTMLLLASFAGVALALAWVGVHGVLSYSVARRRPELGIRMALGATRRDLLALVLRRGGLLAAAGLALGIAGALAAAGLLRSLLYGVEAHDPPTFVAVVGLVLVAALAASWIPARRATRTEPMAALRAE